MIVVYNDVFDDVVWCILFCRILASLIKHNIDLMSRYYFACDIHILQLAIGAMLVAVV
jgi:hypothetical protein